jgi:hypothetical protein
MINVWLADVKKRASDIAENAAIWYIYSFGGTKLAVFGARHKKCAHFLDKISGGTMRVKLGLGLILASLAFSACGGTESNGVVNSTNATRTNSNNTAVVTNSNTNAVITTTNSNTNMGGSNANTGHSNTNANSNMRSNSGNMNTNMKNSNTNH